METFRKALCIEWSRRDAADEQGLTEWNLEEWNAKAYHDHVSEEARRIINSFS